jgi:2-polyprenyl-3-methyl-5-hydroxy-6-metoxy-1,4-benzoquinol methylase
MALFNSLKKGFKRSLEKMGYEIRNLNRLRAANAVIYNTAEYADRFYSDRALVEIYKRENVPQHLQNLRTVLAEEKISLHRDMAILDAGCGTGDCLRMLWQEYGVRQLTGTDFSNSALAITAETCPQANLHQLDMYQRLAQDFDLILCQQVLEHLERPEDALRNMLAMLRPHGLILITVPDGRLDDFAGHIHFWSRDSLPLFLQKELRDCIVRSGPLQDGVSLYATIMRASS